MINTDVDLEACVSVLNSFRATSDSEGGDFCENDLLSVTACSVDWSSCTCSLVWGLEPTRPTACFLARALVVGYTVENSLSILTDGGEVGILEVYSCIGSDHTQAACISARLYFLGGTTPYLLFFASCFALTCGLFGFESRWRWLFKGSSLFSIKIAGSLSVIWGSRWRTWWSQS